MSEKYKFDTMSLHSGHVPDKETGSRELYLSIKLHPMFLRIPMKLLHYIIWK